MVALENVLKIIEILNGNIIKYLTFFISLILKMKEYAIKATTYKESIGLALSNITKLTI